MKRTARVQVYIITRDSSCLVIISYKVFSVKGSYQYLGKNTKKWHHLRLVETSFADPVLRVPSSREAGREGGLKRDTSTNDVTDRIVTLVKGIMAR